VNGYPPNSKKKQAPSFKMSKKKIQVSGRKAQVKVQDGLVQVSRKSSPKKKVEGSCLPSSTKVMA
jgi:hypothetical protein